ncbi:hypothetical protein MIMGU_mgv1a026638mg [Erythranthe guttata]|uniref:F-box domain-containing protein n=1 Tax=Erythranthe guttata TaxID=4155 RepID=A0A022RNU9_ERYGU|nr:hypothetical protein MIMGU_mgv1a026638mg [Erythranthe guttata]
MVNLPFDMVEIILSKLSIESLVRFKSVCKSWNNLISDPTFVRNDQTQRSKEPNSEKLFLLKNLLIEMEAPYYRDHALCFCDGLLLLEGSYKRVTLWNPSTRTSISLTIPYDKFDLCHGLCRDPITDDFKVVILSKKHYAVYSSALGTMIPDTFVILARRESTQIMYFDPRDDKFKFLHKPDNINSDEDKTYYSIRSSLDDKRPIFLFESRGRLCMYCNFIDKTRIRIWRKGKGIDNHSWKKLMTITNVETSIKSFVPQCFVGNKLVIRIRGKKYRNKDDRLVVYNTCKKRFKEFKKTKPVFGIGLVPYIETLYFPIENTESGRKRKRE